MNQTAIEKTAEFIESIDEPLRGILKGHSEKQLFENIYIAKQIELRKQDKVPVQDKDSELSYHIRGMIYAMVSSDAKWKNIEKHIDVRTGRIDALDTILKQYDHNELLKADPTDLLKKIMDKEHKMGGVRRKYQMEKLHKNIKTLQGFQKKSGSIDEYYQKFIKDDPTFKLLIKRLSDSSSEDKIDELGVPLVAEYLRNVGYEIPKPDRHICRILGPNRLGLLKRETDVFGAMEAVKQIASKCNRGIAEVDYILWSYCATGYGEICEKDPKCKEKKCVASELGCCKKIQ